MLKRKTISAKRQYNLAAAMLFRHADEPIRRLWLKRSSLKNAAQTIKHGSPDSNNRIYGLDILRALAILFVMLTHGNNLHTNETIKTITGWVYFDGVSIFFVLSGFLIGGILIKSIELEQPSFRGLLSFWTKRWIRTLPNYFLILIVLGLLCHFILDYPIFSHIKSYFVFLQNFNSAHSVFFPEAWSLSIEEWFYILVPASIFFLASVLHWSNKKSVLFTAAVVIVAVVSFRYYRYLNIPVNTFEEWDLVFRKQVVTRLDSLMFGVIGAYLAYYNKSFWHRHKLAFLLSGIALFTIEKLYYSFASPDYDLYSCVFSFNVTALATLFLLPYLSAIKTGYGFVYKSLTHISLISYSLYLINFSLIQGWVLAYMPWFGLEGTGFTIGRYLCFWIFSIAGATLLYKYFEKPIMNLRSRMK